MYTDSLINSAFTAYLLQYPFSPNATSPATEHSSQFGQQRSKREYDHAHIYTEAKHQMLGPS